MEPNRPTSLRELIAARYLAIKTDLEKNGSMMSDNKFYENAAVKNELKLLLDYSSPPQQTGLARQIAETEVVGSQWRDH
jgi:hypothetical protein